MNELQGKSWSENSQNDLESNLNSDINIDQDSQQILFISKQEEKAGLHLFVT